MIENGYVKKINDALKPNTGIFYKKVADNEPSEKIIELRDELVDLFKQTLSPYISFLDLINSNKLSVCLLESPSNTHLSILFSGGKILST